MLFRSGTAGAGETVGEDAAFEITVEFPGRRQLSWVRRETGKEQAVQVRRNEGVANHIGPEPCAGSRKVVGEASVGVRAGQPLNHDRIAISGADAVQEAEGNTSGRDLASVQTTRRGRRTWHARKLFAREPGDLGFDQSRYRAGPHREGEEP